jgi:NAD-dependent deacetylase
MSARSPFALPPPLVERLAAVRSIGVVTGAGVSAASGVPTYRGQGGLYDDPQEGDRTVEALSGPTLRRDPDRTWRAVATLARASARARPSAAHEAIVRLERAASRFALLTQNVDGLHDRAGSREVIAIHGNVFATRCMACQVTGRLTPEAVRALVGAPRCDCGGTLRPDAVLFGELLPVAEVARLEAAFLHDPPDLVIAAGTTALFDYVAAPLVHAAARGRLTVEVNPEPTRLTAVVDFALPVGAEVALPAIADVVDRPARSR